MDRRTYVAMSSTALLSLFPMWRARAQGQVTARRIGTLSLFARADVEVLADATRIELEKLGWTDSRKLTWLPPRTAEGKNELLPALAAELVAQGPDLILVQSVPAARALVQATKSIPIVMVAVGNPVESGIVPSLGKPGGNVTGSSYLASEFGSKVIQLLKEAVPQLRSIALFINPTNDTAPSYAKSLSAAAVAFGVKPQIVEVSGKDDFEPAFAAIRNAKTEAILLPPEALILANRSTIAAFAQANRLPLAIAGTTRVLPEGGLIAFGPAKDAYAQMAARYVDRILKGAKPGDLAVEQPTRFELVINLKAARALGLTIPQSLLLRADEVIQ